MKWFIAMGAALVFAACSSSSTPAVDCTTNPTAAQCQAVDAGNVDAGNVDAGNVDAGSVDAGSDGGSGACGAEFSPCDGGICEGDVCVAACAINGSALTAGTTNPTNPCETCQPGVNSTGYSPLPDASSCNADGQHFCLADVCVLGCNIPNAGVVDAGALSPSNDCQSCQPAVSPVAFSGVANGVGCSSVDGGGVCFGGTCASGCFINGAFITAGTHLQGNPCRACDPSQSITDYSNVPDNTSCGCGSDGQGHNITVALCTAGACNACAGCTTGAPPCCGTCTLTNTCNLSTAPACN